MDPSLTRRHLWLLTESPVEEESVRLADGEPVTECGGDSDPTHGARLSHPTRLTHRKAVQEALTGVFPTPRAEHPDCALEDWLAGHRLPLAEYLRVLLTHPARVTCQLVTSLSHRSTDRTTDGLTQAGQGVLN